MANEQKVFLLYTNQSGQFNSFVSLLKEDGWRVTQLASIKLLEEYLSKRDGHINCLGIFNPINCQFSTDDLNLLLNFCRTGNSMIVAGDENEDRRNKTNLNDLILRFGISFNDDCIVRPNLYKHYHPKEAQLRDFVVNRGFSETLKKYWKSEELSAELLAIEDSLGNLNKGPQLLYPYGCSLKVAKASTIMWTSSQWAIPSRQAICALYGWSGLRENNTRVIVIGSSQMMADKYIDKEDNRAIIKTMLEYIVNKNSLINVSDAKTVEIPEVIYGPDIERLLDVPISCIQESEQLPNDKMSLINRRLFNIDSSKLPEIARAYQELNVPHEPLSLIKPELKFDRPKLEPATHGFLIRRRLDHL